MGVSQIIPRGRIRSSKIVDYIGGIVYGNSMASKTLEEVELGFLERVDDPSLLAPPFFPSKVGGRPAWADLQHIPTPARLACGYCSKPMVFLLQVYAPQPRVNPEAYHRSIFLFMCRNPGCHHLLEVKGAIRVFRSQFGRREGEREEEETEGEEAEGEEEEAEEEKVGEEEEEEMGKGRDDEQDRRLTNVGHSDPSGIAGRSTGESNVDTSAAPKDEAHLSQTSEDRSLSGSEKVIKSTANSVAEQMKPQGSVGSSDNAELKPKQASLQPPSELPSLCSVCGCHGPMKCGRCKMVTYCSREHQTHDWRAGHKLYCSEMAAGRNVNSDLQYSVGAGILLPEFEIVTEAEPEFSEEPKTRGDEEKMEEYRRMVASGKYVGVDDGGKMRNKRKAAKAVEMAKSDVISDKYFRAFKRRVAMEPEQVCIVSYSG